MTRERLKQAVEAAKAEVRRGHSVAVRLTDGEFARLQRVAKDQGIPASTLARVLVTTGVEDLENGRK